MDLLLPETIVSGLRTTRFGRQVYHFPSTGSTNDVASALAREGAPEGTIVVAEEQSRGRGRLGRAWLAPAGSCLLFSIIFRPSLPTGEAFRLTMLASLAAAIAVERVSGVVPSIKWPNDLLVGHRKLAGILSEGSAVEDKLEYAVVGIGLNVNFEPSAFPEIAETAASLQAEAGRAISRARVLQELLNEIEGRYDTLRPARQGELWAEWRRRLGTLGQRVTVTEGEHREEGTAVDVSPDGSLILRRDDGSEIAIAVGDVTLRG
ncbi:MAG: biotin--[acetyl-CoA-carboxylase] ligase [Chloroflexota bacterium]